MSYIPKTINEVVTEYLNKTTFLPAIQREFVWGTYEVEKLFDSIMGDFPISTFLFWKIKEENKKEWTSYEFIRNYDDENPHNKEASVAGVNQDIYLVLDGQQRLTALFIGLKGSYRYFYYRWHKCKLYLNILKPPAEREDPEELTFDFQFRENCTPDIGETNTQYWYPVGDILDYTDAEDAKEAIETNLDAFTEEQKRTAKTLIGRLHSRINNARILNYYEEKSQDYDKVVEAFIRANTGGVKLEYSDILLSTATAKWKNLNAREEIHSFADGINSIGNGYTFGKDFVLKGSLYLTEGLPIQYKVKNFTRGNLEKIECNWENIKTYLEMTVELMDKFGFSDKSLVAKMALLPISYYLSKLKPKNFIESTNQAFVHNQSIIQKWIVLVLLKNSFGGSSDSTLKNLQSAINSLSDFSVFPHNLLNSSLGIEASFSTNEIEKLLLTNYSTKYSFLLLSILCPDRDWKGKKFHEDHIFPKSEFTVTKLRARGYDSDKIAEYLKQYNAISNIQLLTDIENIEKNSKDFGAWLSSRDSHFKDRNLIPDLKNYHFDNFLEFIKERKKLITNKLGQFKL